MTKVKICGLSSPETLTCALEHGADFIGLVFYPPSPRHVNIEVASYLAGFVPNHIEVVGLFVDPDDKTLEQTLVAVPLTMIQLHGNETIERVREIKEKFNLPVMKAIAISSTKDLTKAQQYEDVADWLLFDALPTTTPKAEDQGEGLPGGNGIAFDWRILKDYQGSKPWMLAGGLTPENIGEALQILSPSAVDVSSGVESAAGIKDIAKIRSFLRGVKKA